MTTPCIIDTTPFWSGRLAKKTKGLKAISPTFGILESLRPYLAINTREGYIPIDPACWICVGADNEPWQQLPSKIEKDYDRVGTEGAWGLYQPKPTKVVEFIEVTPELVTPFSAASSFYIVGRWGQTIAGVEKLQRLHVGDFIARQVDDHGDQWVVQRAIWLRTYEEVPDKQPPEIK
jgi:hypothetical protein